MNMLLIVLIALSAAANAEDLKIIGGNVASSGQFPYHVSILENGNHNCGGTILGTRWILTAASCLNGKNPSSLNVLLGTNTLSTGGSIFKVILTKTHQNWNPLSRANDIGLAKLDKDIILEPGKAFPAGISKTTIGGGVKMTLTGWGKKDINSIQNVTDNLRYLSVYSILNQDCQARLYPNQINPNQMCTLQNYGQGFCYGDTGGPVVYNGQVTGIVSWGKSCGAGYPDVYTRVSAYADWIVQTTNNN